MKRILALILCLVLVVGLFGCTGSDKDSENTATLQVGFARGDITPEYSIQLGGFFNPQNRKSLNVLDPLYASCIAISDEAGSTVLLFQLDLLSSGNNQFAFIRKDISKATGIATDNIIFCATHTHSGPDLKAVDNAAVDKYIDSLEDILPAVAQEALADRKPATMSIASTETKNLNFVRHYRMDDGSVVGSNFGTSAGKTFVKHVKDVDNEMQLIYFTRDGGKDIMLVNYQVHPLRTGGNTEPNISSDLIGVMRSVIEPQIDCHMLYFTGGAGDVAPTSSISSENIASDYIEHGTMLAREAIHASDALQPVDAGKVQVLRREVNTPIKGADSNTRILAVSFGDVSLISAPYEMFDSNGMFIKENSPFAMTIIATCSNGDLGYVAAEWAYEYGGYEVEYTGFDKGVAENLADNYVEMLKELHPTRK